MMKNLFLRSLIMDLREIFLKYYQNLLKKFNINNYYNMEFNKSKLIELLKQLNQTDLVVEVEKNENSEDL